MKSRTKRVAPKTSPRSAANDVAETQEVIDDVDDRICATIAAAIGEGALKPGTKILEDVIADHFGVSRTVVRGALGILQRDHLLERKRNRGTFVAEPSIEEATQLFETRRLMERTIIELVVERAQPADLDHLTDIAEDEKRIHAGSDEPLKTGLSGQFHVEMAKVSGNGVLTELLGNVVARLSLVMALYEEDHSDECGADHHLAIIDAVRRRDVAKAQALILGVKVQTVIDMVAAGLIPKHGPGSGVLFRNEVLAAASQYIITAEISRALGIGYRWVRQRLATGGIEPLHALEENRALVFDRSDVTRFLETAAARGLTARRDRGGADDFATHISGGTTTSVPISRTAQSIGSPTN